MVRIRTLLGVVIVAVSPCVFADNNQQVCTSIGQLKRCVGIQNPVQLVGLLGKGIVSEEVVGSNPNRKVKGLVGDQYTYLLHIAVRAGNPDSVSQLLKLGGDLSLTDSQGNTPVVSSFERLREEESRSWLIRVLFPSQQRNILRILLDHAKERFGV